MDRDVGGLGAEFASAIKYGTGEIEPVMDIGGESGVTQYHPHFATDRLQAEELPPILFGGSRQIIQGHVTTGIAGLPGWAPARGLLYVLDIFAVHTLPWESV